MVEDPSVLLDLLIGAETEFLPYLTLLLRHAIDTWPVKNAHWPARTPQNKTRFYKSPCGFEYPSAGYRLSYKRVLQEPYAQGPKRR